MFTQLTNLAYRRTPLQAFGFYLAYFALFIALGTVFAALLVLMLGPELALEYGTQIGPPISMIVNVALAFAILFQKKLIGHTPLFITLALIAGLLGLFGGALLGFIPIAYLTTQPPMGQNIHYS